MEFIGFAGVVLVIIAALGAFGAAATRLGVDSRRTEAPTGFSPWR